MANSNKDELNFSICNLFLSLFFRYTHSTECSRIPHLFDTTCMHHACIFIGPNDEEHYMRLAFYQGANSTQLVMTLKQYRISELID